MEKEIKITINNKLILEKRDINVYHHFTKSAHLISYGCSITLPLRMVSEDDYLHISVVSGPGRLEGNCVVNVPSWIDFELSAAGDATMVHSDNRTIIRIPAGPPTWQLKMTQAANKSIEQCADIIIVGDDCTENF